MPIYEFYCADCHAIYNFFAQQVDTEIVPGCPSGEQHQLNRRPSRFATLSSTGDEAEDDLIPGIDEDRLERAMDQMAAEFIGIEEGEEDPKQLARLFRRFSDLGGVEPGPMLEEVLAKLESADDLAEVESDLDSVGDDGGDLNQLFRARKALKDWRKRNPYIDETLHFL